MDRRGFLKGLAGGGVIAAATGYEATAAGVLLPRDQTVLQPVDHGLAFDGMVRNVHVHGRWGTAHGSFDMPGRGAPEWQAPDTYHTEITLDVLGPLTLLGGDLATMRHCQGCLRCIITSLPGAV